MWQVSQITTSATPSSCQTTKIVLQLFAIIWQGLHLFKASMSQVPKQTSYFVAFRQTQATNNGSPARNNLQTQRVSQMQMWTHTLKGKPKNHTLLAIAIVEVRNKSGQYVPCRALLDSGSQSHFITERLCKFWDAKVTNTHIHSGHIKCKHLHRAQCVHSFKV